MHLADKEKESAFKLAEANLKNTLQDEIAKRDREIAELTMKNDLVLMEKLAQKERELAEQINKKEMEIAAMKATIDKATIQQQLTFNQAIQQIEKERDILANDIKTKEREKELLENPWLKNTKQHSKRKKN